MDRLTLCMVMLLVSGAAAAADPLSGDPAQHATEAKSPDASAVNPTVAKHAEEPAKAAASPATSPAPQKDASKDDGAGGTAPTQPVGDVKMSGMSVLGNEEAPKSLVIVPWKSSQMGDMPSVARLLDSSRQPVDKEVFMRELAYYELRSNPQ